MSWTHHAFFLLYVEYLEIACNTKKEASDLNRDRQKAYGKLNNPKPLEEGEIAFETPFQIFMKMRFYQA